MRVSTKIYVFAGASALFVFAIIGVAVKQVDLMGKEVTVLADMSIPVSRAAAALSGLHMEQALHFERARLIGELMVRSDGKGNRFEIERDSLQKSEVLINEEFAKIRTLVKGIHQDKRNREFEQEVLNIDFALRTAYMGFAKDRFREERILNLFSHGEREQAKVEALELDKQYEEGTMLAKEIKSLLLRIEEFSTSSIIRTERRRHNAFVFMLAISMLSTVSCVVAATCIVRSIVVPLKKLRDQAFEIGSGQMDVGIDVRSRDEIGDLGESFNEMLATLKNMILKIMGTSVDVSASSQQLSAFAQQSHVSVQQVASSIQQLAKGARTQAEKIEETTKVMTELNASIEQSAKSAQEASVASTQAADSAEKGNESVRETVSSVDKIFESTTVASDAVAKLTQRSEQMDAIVTVITNVADQTNLLALNAAIEAARAGEAGRGFAVVAEEVRKLAESSAKSAAEIGTLIKDTTRDTELASRGMQNTFDAVIRGREVTAMTGRSIEEILGLVQSVSVMLQQISAGSQQMSSGSKQVVQSMADVSGIAEEASASTQQAGSSTQQLVATMQEMASSAQALAGMGTELNDLVAEFKTGDEKVMAAPHQRESTARPQGEARSRSTALT